jgi:hypothetical protein
VTQSKIGTVRQARFHIRFPSRDDRLVDAGAPIR